MSEELLDSEPLRPSITRTIEEVAIEEEPTIHNTPDTLRSSELYYFGYQYQRNMGDYINSINNSFTLIHDMSFPPFVNRRTNHNQRFSQVDEMVFRYNQNIRNYNENVNLLLGSFNNNNNIQQLPISPVIPVIPSISIPRTPSPTSIPTLLTNLLNRPNDMNRTYLLFPRRNVTTERVGLTLTPEQFASSTEQLIYNSTDTSGNDRCPICFDEFIEGEYLTKILHCGHVFKTVPLNNWFLRSSTCPVCRFDLQTSTTPHTTSVDL
jgi:hypothetical protein